ncbi:unnamed protein product [Adineta steineri]|uniref:F-box domain-containing protein n=1 Tax=Adineta steineri TaxID=433720 RepID=A0A819LYL1_9BILA|nr:unnamed protein product [Adineta steineri]CAF3969952.1 unnamed protein product [Adineta steineri]
MTEVICLDRLSTELILEIFDYLSSNDLIYSFHYLNKRFNDILFHHDRLINNFRVPTSNLNFSNDIFQLIGPKIKYLTLTTNDLNIPWNFLSNLKSLTISSSIPLNCDHFNPILNSEQFHNLESSKIKSKIYSEEIYHSDDHIVEGTAFTPIFYPFNKFKTFQYLSTVSPFQTVDDISGMDISPHLQKLSLKLWEFETIYFIIQYCPNLKNLDLIITIIHPVKVNDELDLSTIHLKKFSLTMNDTNRSSQMTRACYHYLAKFIKHFSETLTSLSLNFCGEHIVSDSPFILNGTQLQDKLLQYMKELKNFNFYMSCQLRSRKNLVYLLQTFKNSFWLDHNWIVATHENYIYTLPFHFSHFYGFTHFDQIISTDPNIFQINSRLWYKIKSIELSKSFKINPDLIEQIRRKIPNLTTIIFNQVQPIDQNNFKDNVTLSSVNTIHFNDASLNYIQPWITYVLPNLKHLFTYEKFLPKADTELAILLNKKLETLHMAMLADQIIEPTDFYLFNVKDITITIFAQFKPDENVLLRILKSFTNFNILTIHFKCNTYYNSRKPWGNIKQLIDKLDMNEINKNYQMKYFFNSVQFSRNTHVLRKRKLSEIDLV